MSFFLLIKTSSLATEKNWQNSNMNIFRGLERMGKDCAVIYGSLPPGTKLAMSERFNDPKHPCKIMVATDAIGMGLNLNIRRIIFYSLNKIHLLEDGNREMKVISVSQALQIAGRAGKLFTGNICFSFVFA